MPPCWPRFRKPPMPPLNKHLKHNKHPFLQARQRSARQGRWLMHQHHPIVPLAYSEEAVQTGSSGMAARREPIMLALQSEASPSVPTEERKGGYVEDRDKHHT